MSELRTQLINAARLSFNSGHWLLTARLCETLAELEMEAAIADTTGEAAWNARVERADRMAERRPCPFCGTLTGPLPETHQCVSPRAGGRTIAVPLQERPGPRRLNEHEMRCKECGRLAYVEMHNVGIHPGEASTLPGLARHADPAVDMDHRVRIKA